jgi:hypothetical protein
MAHERPPRGGAAKNAGAPLRSTAGALPPPPGPYLDRWGVTGGSLLGHRATRGTQYYCTQIICKCYSGEYNQALFGEPHDPRERGALPR